MNISLLEHGESAPAGHAVQDVRGVSLCRVLADDAIDQRPGAGTKQIHFYERILFLKHVHELLALRDRNSGVPSHPPFLLRLGEQFRIRHLSDRVSKT